MSTHTSHTTSARVTSGGSVRGRTGAVTGAVVTRGGSVKLGSRAWRVTVVHIPTWNSSPSTRGTGVCFGISVLPRLSQVPFFDPGSTRAYEPSGWRSRMAWRREMTGSPLRACRSMSGSTPLSGSRRPKVTSASSSGKVRSRG